MAWSVAWDEDIEKAWGIHHLIRQGRVRLGLSEQAFAAAGGVSRGAVQQWEKPGGSTPRRTNQPRVAEVLGITVGELMADGPRVSAVSAAALPGVPLLPVTEAYYLDIDNFHDVYGHETFPSQFVSSATLLRSR